MIDKQIIDNICNDWPNELEKIQKKLQKANKKELKKAKKILIKEFALLENQEPSPTVNIPLPGDPDRMVVKINLVENLLKMTKWQILKKRPIRLFFYKCFMEFLKWWAIKMGGITLKFDYEYTGEITGTKFSIPSDPSQRPEGWYFWFKDLSNKFKDIAWDTISKHPLLNTLVGLVFGAILTLYIVSSPMLEKRICETKNNIETCEYHYSK